MNWFKWVDSSQGIKWFICVIIQNVHIFGGIFQILKYISKKYICINIYTKKNSVGAYNFQRFIIFLVTKEHIVVWKLNLPFIYLFFVFIQLSLSIFWMSQTKKKCNYPLIIVDEALVHESVGWHR